MKLRHVKSGRRITVSADHADIYKTQGWVEYRESSKKKDDDAEKDSEKS